MNEICENLYWFFLIQNGKIIDVKKLKLEWTYENNTQTDRLGFLNEKTDDFLLKYGQNK